MIGPQLANYGMMAGSEDDTGMHNNQVLQMKKIPLKAMVALLASSALLGGCGGGGDDNAGSLTALGVVPDTIEVSGTNGCAVNAGPVKVIVVGGAAPYRLENLFPTAVALDRTSV